MSGVMRVIYIAVVSYCLVFGSVLAAQDTDVAPQAATNKGQPTPTSRTSDSSSCPNGAAQISAVSLDVQTAEALRQMRSEVDCLFKSQLDTLNQIGPKLLSSEDKSEIRQSLLADFSAQIAQLRSELEDEIQSLRKEQAKGHLAAPAKK